MLLSNFEVDNKIALVPFTVGNQNQYITVIIGIKKVTFGYHINLCLFSSFTFSSSCDLILIVITCTVSEGRCNKVKSIVSDLFIKLGASGKGLETFHNICWFCDFISYFYEPYNTCPSYHFYVQGSS